MSKFPILYFSAYNWSTCGQYKYMRLMFRVYIHQLRGNRDVFKYISTRFCNRQL